MADFKVRIAIIGSERTGKTALAEQFVREHIVTRYIPTVETLYSREREVAGVRYLVEVLDTSGYTLLFDAFAGRYAEEADAFICVFSLVDPRSLAFARDALVRIGVERSLLARTALGKPVLLVATRGDCVLHDGEEVAKGKELGKDFMCPVVVLSALDHEAVALAFDKIIARGAVSVEKKETAPGPQRLTRAALNKITSRLSMLTGVGGGGGSSGLVTDVASQGSLASATSHQSTTSTPRSPRVLDFFSSRGSGSLAGSGDNANAHSAGWHRTRSGDKERPHSGGFYTTKRTRSGLGHTESEGAGAAAFSRHSTRSDDYGSGSELNTPTIAEERDAHGGGRGKSLRDLLRQMDKDLDKEKGLVRELGARMGLKSAGAALGTPLRRKSKSTDDLYLGLSPAERDELEAMRSRSMRNLRPISDAHVYENEDAVSPRSRRSGQGVKSWLRPWRKSKFQD